MSMFYVAIVVEKIKEYTDSFALVSTNKKAFILIIKEYFVFFKYGKEAGRYKLSKKVL
ncbi:hypothetical protein [Clostridium saccharoperbutylacetonicum]|uniref:hypothetical protein n=1 Tax=Clostridium saccharoperbutylacetonicum TaxID=36745 RepID=UPI001570B1FA|nr:hypothetical protein [Clostridium saccharoperbutylacetonicum]